jgi:hypothetical protein
LRAVVWQKGKQTHVWLANLRDGPVEVKFRGLQKGNASAPSIDENCFEHAVSDTRFGDQGKELMGASMELKPFAIVHVTIKV